MTIRTAIDTLTEALDHDEGYRISWKANIAMAFKDEVSRRGIEIDAEELHEAANAAADNFLNLLCFKPRG